MRSGAATAAVIVTLVLGATAYIWMQDRSAEVEYAVVTSSIGFTDRDDPELPDEWREEPGPEELEPDPEHLLVVDVSWRAAEGIPGGSYFVLVAVPPGWAPYRCAPDCDFGATDDLDTIARSLPRSTSPESANAEAAETGRITVAYAPTPGRAGTAEGFEPAAWLVQTDGEHVLNFKQIPPSE
ncbi:MAG: hypothetical protein GEU93_07315 [Propionibacteriales bacterium]|nr:hypothetical protein [Propionibacteriales bacterium]